MRSYVAPYIVLVLLLNAPSHSQDGVPVVDPLIGLSGVMVDVVPPSPQLEERGITAAVIGAEVERSLKAGGVPVLFAGDDALAPGMQTLVVEVLAIFDEYSQQCTWTIRVELEQAVRMERNPDTLAFLAPTWSVAGLGYQTKDWRQALVNDVGFYTNRFVEAFALSNPEGISGN